MSGHYRIRVYGKPRKNIDPALLAQVVILLGRHLHQQRQQRQQQHSHDPGLIDHPDPAADHTEAGDEAGKDASSPGSCQEQVMTHPAPPSGEDVLPADNTQTHSEPSKEDVSQAADSRDEGNAGGAVS